MVSLLISRLPPDSQVATRDVAEAYRTIPLHPSQWPGAVVRLADDEFSIDTATCFGVSPSAGGYGCVADAGAELFRHHGIAPMSKWVDDHVFFRIRREHLAKYNELRQTWHTNISLQPPHHDGGRLWFGGQILDDRTLDEFDEDCSALCQDLSSQSPRSSEDNLFTYNFDDIDRLSDQLGIPWEKSKDLPFASSTTFIGLEWNLSTLTVSLPSKKKTKYLMAIQEWNNSPTHTLNDVQRVYGKLLHTSLVIPAGRAYLTGLEAMLGLYSNSPFMSRHPPKSVHGDLQWWSSRLAQEFLGRPIPSPKQLTDLGAYSDASSGIGIAIIINGRWRAWRLIPGWQTLSGQRDIGWAEAIGFELLTQAISRSTSVIGYTATTKESSKAGGTHRVETHRSMKHSSAYMHSPNLYSSPPPSTPCISPANSIPLTPPPAASTPHTTSSCHPSSYPPASTTSSLMPPCPTPPANFACYERVDTQRRLPNALQTLSRTLIPRTIMSTVTSTQHSVTLDQNGTTNTRRPLAPLPTINSTSKPHQYRQGLMPLSSPLRPHCLARDRLRLWTPTNSRAPRDAAGCPIRITDVDLDRILTVMSVSWAQGTRTMYGSGLLAYHLFCDQRGIPEHQRCPASPILILAFIASSAGAYSGSTLANYVFAVRAWHILHGQTWLMVHTELKAALDGATILTPPSSCRLKRQPITVQFLIAAKLKLDMMLPFNAAFYACLTTAFYSLARLGEFTVPSLKAFDPDRHVKRSNMSSRRDRNNFQVSVLHIPVTKTSRKGEDVYWSAQTDQSDPEAAIAHHFHVNMPPHTDHLFAWRHPNGLRPLTREAFMTTLKDLCKSLDIECILGHGIRIGGTLELLLRGVPFDVTKTIGRWSSQAFLVYLCDHAIVMAPYMQNTPILEPFLQYTMPPPR